MRRQREAEQRAHRPAADAAVGQRPQPRAPHQRVGVALVDLIEDRRAAGHERRAGHGDRHLPQSVPCAAPR